MCCRNLKRCWILISKQRQKSSSGKTLDQNLLSVVFDYDGNLWFATGGFRIYPDRQQQGAIGYISRTAIDAILNGEETDLSDAVFVHELTPGEGAENGIAASSRRSGDPDEPELLSAAGG